ncbi:hypothetical protein ARSEF1564_009614 [Beauveria bassiana]
MGSLILLHSSTADREGLAALAAQAEKRNVNNVAFSCCWLLGDVQKCQAILSKTEWYADSVLFAQTYKPSLAAGAVAVWKENLEKPKKARAAKLIGFPARTTTCSPSGTTG